MKKACAVLLMLALLMTGVCANAAVHTISQLESDLTLPAGVTVFRDNSGDDIIDILYSLDGREDVAFETAVTYMEAYEGYTNGTLPQEALDALNSYYEQVAGDMPANSKERFSLYVFAGSLYNTAMTWLKDDRGEEPDEVAEVFCDSIGIL